MEEMINTQKIKKFFGEPVKQTACSNVLRTSNQETNIRGIEENMSYLYGHGLNNMLHENSKNLVFNRSFKVNNNCNFRYSSRVDGPNFMRNNTFSEVRKFPSNINFPNKDTSSFLSRKFGLASKSFLDSKLNSENCKYKGVVENFRNEYCRQGNFDRVGFSYRDNTLNTASNVLEVENLEETASNSVFSEPRATNFWARKPTVAAQLPGSYIYENSLSNVNPFNTISVSRKKELDIFTKSRFPFSHVESQKDNCSISSTVVKATSGKAQMSEMLERLHHRILNLSPDMPVEALRLEFEKAKEELESVDELSFAYTIREGDDVSSNISKVSYPLSSRKHWEQLSASLKSGRDVLRSLQSTNIMGKPTKHPLEKMEPWEQLSVSLKSGRDVLRSLQSANITGKLTGRSLEKKKSSGFPSFENERNISDDEDSALLFKKPKPPKSFSGKKKLNSNLLKIKSPPVKNLKSKITNKMFSLKHWRPLPMDSDLLLCGVNDSGETIKTEAIKKRINNSVVELIGGTTCKLIGSPVSTLPKRILLKLENGIPRCWKLLQKELVSDNMSENRRALITSTESEKNQSSKTRKTHQKKNEMFKISISRKNLLQKRRKTTKLLKVLLPQTVTN